MSAVYRHEPYTITLTLTVSDEDRDGVWIVTEGIGHEFGDGLTPYLAVADFLHCKAAFMRSLLEEAPNLGKDLRRELEQMTVWAEGRPT